MVEEDFHFDANSTADVQLVFVGHWLT